MGSKPKKPKAAPVPDPATRAVSLDDNAAKQAMLEYRRRGGFYRRWNTKRYTAPAGSSGVTNTGGAEGQVTG